MGEEAADLRGEDEPPIALRVVERLLAHSIAGGEERLALGVPQDEGEHPVEVVEALLAKLLPGVDDHLGVGAGGEAVSARGQALGETPVVIELPVEHGVDGPRLVGDRLVPGGQIDDREPPVAERDGAVDVVSFVVGPAVAQGGRHPADDSAVGAPAIQRDEAAKAAHGRA